MKANPMTDILEAVLLIKKAHQIILDIKCSDLDGSRSAQIANAAYYLQEVDCEALLALHAAQPVWRPMEEAKSLPIGASILVWRPLAHLTQDANMRVVETTSYNHKCWPKTIPEGEKDVNYTTGLCWCAAWQPVPEWPNPPTAAPTEQQGGGQKWIKSA